MYVYMIPGGSTFGQICLVSGLLFLPFYLIGKKKREKKREEERIAVKKFEIDRIKNPRPKYIFSDKFDGWHKDYR
ncbi:MAG: hypothetical protein SOX31_07790 [Eubacteriales bacterium]|nr:hypothetical protein [Eubacteriales bacterium]